MPTTQTPDLAVVGSVVAHHRSHAPAAAFASTVVVIIAYGVVAGTAPTASALTVIVLVPAALVDLRERRLPDRWLLLGAATFATAATLTGLLGETTSPAGALAGSATMTLPVLALHLLSPAAMGFGDVKAAAVLGLAAGAVHWQLALTALTLAAGSAAVVGIGTRRHTIPFGPFLVVGTALALAASDMWLPTTTGPTP